MKLCLDSLTVTDTEPVDLIRGARSAGFDLVSLWVQPPSLFPKQLVTEAKAKACLAALAETGMRVGPLEVFVLSSADAIRSYRPAMELGARLGARTASAINLTTTDAGLLSELFVQFAALAGECGLGVTLEPLAGFATSTPAQAREIIRASGVDARIVLDAHHLVRTGVSVADVRALDPALIGYVQVCDGLASLPPEERAAESVCARLYPGEGVWPLVEYFRDAPMDIDWGIEAPSVRRAAAGQSAETQAREAMASVRRLIEQIAAARATRGGPV